MALSRLHGLHRLLADYSNGDNCATQRDQDPRHRRCHRLPGFTPGHRRPGCRHLVARTRRIVPRRLLQLRTERGPRAHDAQPLPHRRAGRADDLDGLVGRHRVQPDRRLDGGSLGPHTPARPGQAARRDRRRAGGLRAQLRDDSGRALLRRCGLRHRLRHRDGGARRIHAGQTQEPTQHLAGHVVRRGLHQPAAGAAVLFVGSG
ncbi:hypothetical protein D9M72_470320 [compost metagenome]